MKRSGVFLTRWIGGIMLIACAVGLFSSASPRQAEAAVSGQKEAWKAVFGSKAGQFYNPRLLGVDPVDGSVYVSDGTPDFTEVRIDKFSAGGTLEGSVSFPREAEEEGASGNANLLGIAVDHSLGRFYVLQDEAGLEESNPEERIATRIRAFSTTPVGGKIVPAAVPFFKLPAANTATTLVKPQGLQVDPTDHDLVIAAATPGPEPGVRGNVVFQRFTSSGLPGPRYEEQGSTLRAGEEESSNFVFAVSPTGTTEIVAEVEGASGIRIEGFQLQDFSSGLAPIPGFAAASAREGWGAMENQGELTIKNVNFADNGWGPQLAITEDPDGEESLFWKTGARESPTSVILHGFSLQQQQTTVAFGGGEVTRECRIESATAAIAAGTDGDLVVLDQGGEVGEASQTPAFPTNVFRFGAGGSKCPDPASLIKLRSGTTEVGSVPAGTAVTFDASGSEFPGTSSTDGKPRTLKELIWTVEGPSGTEVFPVTGKPPSEQLEHAFGIQGEYEIRLDLKTDLLAGVGTFFAAKPVKLKVTAGSGSRPTVSSIAPTHGSASGGVVVTINGTNLSGPTGVSFGGTAATDVEAVSSTQVRATSPACTPGSTVDVTVSTGGGTSATTTGDRYGCDSNGQPAPTVSEVSPRTGPAAGGTVVTITGTNLSGASEVKFGAAPATAITPVGANELKATSPAGSGEVDVVVSTGAGSSAAGPADKFTYDSSSTRAFSVDKAGSGAGSVSCNGGRCATSYPLGSVVILSALASNGSTFVGWNGANCSGTGGCQIKVEGNVSVTAAFNLVGTTSVPAAATPKRAAAGTSSATPKPGAEATAPKKTKAQIIAENRKKALKECQKLKGNAKKVCVKRADQVGKEKQKPVREFGAEEKSPKKHPAKKKRTAKKKHAGKHSAKKSKS